MMVINKYTVDELDSFYKAMKNGNRYVMLRGGTGTGKTMYAKELAWRLTHDVDESKLSDILGEVKYKIYEKKEQEEQQKKEKRSFICFIRKSGVLSFGK